MLDKENDFLVPSWMDLGDSAIKRLADVYDFEDNKPYSVILKDNKFNCIRHIRDEYGELNSEEFEILLSKFTNKELKYILDEEI